MLDGFGAAVVITECSSPTEHITPHDRVHAGRCAAGLASQTTEHADMHGDGVGAAVGAAVGLLVTAVGTTVPVL